MNGAVIIIRHIVKVNVSMIMTLYHCTMVLLTLIMYILKFAVKDRTVVI